MTADTRIAELESEQAAFDRQLEELMRDHRGKFALFEGGQPQGFYGSYSEAFKEGLRRYGTSKTFLISKVEPHDGRSISVAWDLGVMFAE